jgi:lipopolysaccharide export system protein LptA
MKTFIAVLCVIFALAAFTSIVSLSGQADRTQPVRVSADTLAVVR